MRKLAPRSHVLGNPHTRRKLLAAGFGGAALLGYPTAIRGQGDNVRGDEPTEEPTEEQTEDTTTEETPVSQVTPVDGTHLTDGLFPDKRVLLYYGFPDNPNMGILGEHEPADLLERLKEQAEEYQQADPDREVIIGFELIASVAQEYPGNDGMHIADTDGAWLDEYTEFTAKNNMVLFFDLQMGYKEPYTDYIGLEPWMKEPHCHMGLDPEFHWRGDEKPLIDIGQVTADEVIEAQNYLIGLAADNNLPRKSLIVHQFHLSMIEEKERIQPLAGVDLIIDMDGWGPPWMKMDTYDVVITQHPIEYNGIKLFYRQDDPLMSAEEVLALDPSPDLIIYQ